MDSYFKTKRLTLLALLVGLTYAFLIVNTVIKEWDSFQIGWHEGAQGDNFQVNGNVSKRVPNRSYYLSLTPKNSIYNYPDSLVNQLDQTTVQAQNHETIVLGSSGLTSRSSGWYGLFLFIFGIIIFATYIVIPFHFYKLIGWIQKDIIFENEIIRLSRWLGIELLIVYFGNVLFNYISYKINTSIFSFSEYDINMHSMDAIWLLFGTVVLLIGEILSKALVLKEEQKLTI